MGVLLMESWGNGSPEDTEPSVVCGPSMSGTRISPLVRRLCGSIICIGDCRSGFTTLPPAPLPESIPLWFFCWMGVWSFGR
jgi:hypothetical protein